jgi:FixJ family two-component response regulator
MRQSDDAVFVVDDDLAVREALRSLLGWLGLRCETFESAAAFLAAERPDVPSCLVLDVHLPGLSGLDLPAELSRSGQVLPIVFITGQGTIPMGVRAMKAGAVEFLTKPFDECQLLSAIEQALGRDRAAREERVARRAFADRVDRLSAPERAVLDLAIVGRTDQDIAASLGISPRAAARQRDRVMSKLEVSDVEDLAQLMPRSTHLRKPSSDEQLFAAIAP